MGSTRGRRRAWSLGLAAWVAASSVGALSAQVAGARDDFTWRLGGGLGASVVLGESDLLDVGLGLDLNGSWARGWAGRLGMRGSLGVMTLGADGGADNVLVHALAGPLLAVELGPVAPWLHPVVGVVGTWWDRGPGPDPDAPDLARRGTSATWGLGVDGGLALRLSRGGAPVSLELGGRVLNMGSLTFARASLAGPDAFRRDGAVVTARIGLSVGLGR